MQLVFEAETPEDLRAEILDFAKAFGLELVKTNLKVLESEQEKPTVISEEKKKKTAKKKVESEVVTTPPVEPITYTKEDATNALQELCSKKDIATAKKLLTEYGASRVSELTENQFPKFIMACKHAAGE